MFISKGWSLAKGVVNLVLILFLFFTVIGLLGSIWTLSSDNQQSKKTPILQIIIGLIKLLMITFVLYYTRAIQIIKNLYLSYTRKYDAIKSINYNVPKKQKVVKKQTSDHKMKKKKPKRMTILESMDKEHQQFYAHQSMKRKTSIDSQIQYMFLELPNKPVKQRSSQQKKQFEKLTEQYNKLMKTMGIQDQQRYLEKVKSFLRKILVKRLKQNEENKQTLKELFEDIYEERIVWTTSQLGDKVNKNMRNFQLLKNEEEYQDGDNLGDRGYPFCYNNSILLEEVLKVYRESRLFNTFRKKNNQNSNENLLKTNNLEKIIRKQCLLDSYFTFTGSYQSSNERQDVTQKLTQIVHQLDHHQNIFQEDQKRYRNFQNSYQTTRYLLMFLTKQLNMCLPKYYKSEIHFTDVFASRPTNNKIKCYEVKKIKTDTCQILHYVLQDRTRGQDKQIATKPGKDNIFTIFMLYIHSIKRDRQLVAPISIDTMFDELHFD